MLETLKAAGDLACTIGLIFIGIVAGYLLRCLVGHVFGENRVVSNDCDTCYFMQNYRREKNHV